AAVVVGDELVEPARDGGARGDHPAAAFEVEGRGFVVVAGFDGAGLLPGSAVVFAGEEVGGAEGLCVALAAEAVVCAGVQAVALPEADVAEGDQLVAVAMGEGVLVDGPGFAGVGRAADPGAEDVASIEFEAGLGAR